MTSRLLRTLSVAGAALALSSGAYAQDAVKVGMFGPRSGPAANSGLAFEKAFQYVVKQANDAGGITVDGKPKKIELILEDSQSKPDVGLSAAQKLLTRDNVDILAGDMVHSDVTLAVMELASSFPKIMYTGEPTSLAIEQKIASDKKKYSNIWKWDFSSDAYAATVHDTVEFIVASGKANAVKKVVGVVAEDTGFSKPILEHLRPAFEKSGWTVVLENVPIGQADFYPQLSKFRANEPAFVVSIFTAANSAIALAKQLREQGLKSVHVGVNGPGLPGFIVGAGPAAEGTVFAPMLFDPVNNPKHKEFAEKLSAAVGDKDIGNDHVNGYCNAALLMDVIKRAGSTDLKKLNDAFASTDFSCLVARWVFKPDTHGPKIGADFFAVPSGQIQGGKRFAIWPKAQATAEFKPIQ